MFSLMHTHMRTHTQISRDWAAFGLYKMLTVSLFHTFTDLYCHLDPSGGFGHQEHAQLHVLHVQTHSCTHVTTHNHTPLNLTHKTWSYNEFYAYVRVCHKSSDVHGNTLTHSLTCAHKHTQTGMLPRSLWGQTQHQCSNIMVSKLADGQRANTETQLYGSEWGVIMRGGGKWGSWLQVWFHHRAIAHTVRRRRDAAVCVRVYNGDIQRI